LILTHPQARGIFVMLEVF